MVRQEMTAREWFAEATRCYLELHQGCAWCGGSYRVFRRLHGRQSEFSCSFCDFRVTRDEETGQTTVVPGEVRSTAPTTMFEFHAPA